MEARPDLRTESERKGRASIRVWSSTPATGARATLSTPALPDESVIEVRFPPSRGVSGHQPVWESQTGAGLHQCSAGRTTYSATEPTTLSGKSLRYLGDCPDLVVICHRSMMAPPSWASPTVRGQGFFAEGPG